MEEFTIGSLYTPHDGFDTVIHLAYINPSFNRGLQHREYRVIENVHEFGIYDTDSDARRSSRHRNFLEKYSSSVSLESLAVSQSLSPVFV